MCVYIYIYIYIYIYCESFCQAETLRLCMTDEFKENRVDCYT